jgi:hypothetical protein
MTTRKAVRNQDVGRFGRRTSLGAYPTWFEVPRRFLGLPYRHLDPVEWTDGEGSHPRGGRQIDRKLTEINPDTTLVWTARR